MHALARAFNITAKDGVCHLLVVGGGDSAIEAAVAGQLLPPLGMQSRSVLSP